MSGFWKSVSTLKAKLFVIGSCSLLLGLVACSNSRELASTTSSTPTPERKVTSAGVVNAQPQSTEITVGGSGETVVRLTIQKGYHVNANPPTFPYLKATELEITPAGGISIGKVIYPTASIAKFAFAEEPLAVYEGETQLKAQLNVDKAALAGNRSLTAVLRIQACDDQVCYPPGKIDLQIPVTIK